MKFVATKKGITIIFFHPSLLLLFLDPGSEIRDLGSGMGKNQDLGYISDPQHWAQEMSVGAELPAPPPLCNRSILAEARVGFEPIPSDP